MKKGCFFCILILLLILSSNVNANVIHVPGDSATIQAGINGAENGDTVLVADGIYSGEGNYNISAMGKAVYIRSQSGPEYTTINAQGLGNGFHFENYDEDTLTVVDGFTITDSQHAIYLTYSAPKLVNLSLTGNANYGIYAYSPAGFIIRSSTLTNNANGIYVPSFSPIPIIIDSCHFENNAQYGILSWHNCHTVTIKNSHFVNNGDCIEAYFSYDSTLLLIDSCIFEGNNSVAWGSFSLMNSEVLNGNIGIGGSIGSPTGGRSYIAANCILKDLTGTAITPAEFTSITDCIIFNNSGPILYGMCLPDYYMHLSLTNCRILNNAGGISLGASYVYFSMSNCEYINNGDAIDYSCDYSGSCSLSGCTVIKNDNGVSFGSEAITPAISNSIIAFNGGYGIKKTGSVPINISCCDIFDNDGGDYVDTDDQTGYNGNFSLDPRFCDSDNDNYYLAANSPCAPENNSCSTLIGALPVDCDTILKTWYVSIIGNDTTGDGSHENPFATIQKGIGASIDGDSVVVLPGTYTGDGNREIAILGKAIYLKGEKGADSTIIDVQGEMYDAFRMDTTIEDTFTVIDGFTITNAQSAFYMVIASPKLINLKILNNVNVNPWPPIWPCRIAPLFRNCEFANNSEGIIYDLDGGPFEPIDSGYVKNCFFASNAGSAICLESEYGYVSISNCTFENNGTGFRTNFSLGTGLIDSCDFYNNGIAAFGMFNMTNCNIIGGTDGVGAMVEGWDDAYSVTDCLFEGLTGTVFLAADPATAVNCIIRNNSGEIAYGIDLDVAHPTFYATNCQFYNNGGGIWVTGYADAHISLLNCLYKDNGMGIGCIPGSIIVSDCHIIDNNSTALNSYAYNTIISNTIISGNAGAAISASPYYSGGSISINQSTLFGNDSSGVVAELIDGNIIIENSIISNNGFMGIECADWFGGIVDFSCNDFFANDSGNYDTTYIPDQTGLNGNISLNPLFCNPDTGDFSLSYYSPCLPENNGCEVQMGAEGMGCDLPDADFLYIPEYIANVSEHDGQARVPIRYNCKTATTSMNIPVEWYDSQLALDSVITEDYACSSWQLAANINNDSDFVYFGLFDLYNDYILAGWDTSIAGLGFTVIDTVNYWDTLFAAFDTAFSGVTGRQLLFIDTLFNEFYPQVYYDTVAVTYTPGDPSLNGSINILDITLLIAYLYKGKDAPKIIGSADANGDCMCNILDITYLISFLYHETDPPVMACSNVGSEQKRNTLYGSLNLSKDNGSGNTVVSVTTPVDLAGMELVLSCEPGNEVIVSSLRENIAAYYSQREGEIKIGLLDINGEQAINSGTGDILLINTSVEIDSALGADINSQPVYFTSRGKSIDNAGIPSQFALEQNNPNPFNPFTAIRFALPQASHVKLEVYNILGQKIETLANEYMQAGWHSVFWDGSGVGSGVYFYRIETGSFKDSKKMILIK